LNITFIFFLGLLIALIGVIPPGLLNMTAAKISLKEGPGRGIMFSTGVCITVFIQTYLAAIFARFLSTRPDVIAILQKVAFVLFILIAVYFLIIARRKQQTEVEDEEVKSKRGRLLQGMVLASLNLFPIPYQAYMTITLASFGWLNFDKTSITTYVTGAVMGTFVMLYVYIFFFDKIKNNPLTSQKNMNFIIGGITGLVALVTLINIIKDL
jgi:threonine/homoserine/homoserine lactone efflux protein